MSAIQTSASSADASAEEVRPQVLDHGQTAREGETDLGALRFQGQGGGLDEKAPGGDPAFVGPARARDRPPSRRSPGFGKSKDFL